ncbi:MAG: radical SAM protein [Azospirillaceae bacterium]|nr:radical SAM protein [Azospirillaceae bacterium]
MSRLYSNLKFLRHTTQLDALRDRTMVAPVHVRIKPMNHCNQSCWFCAYRADNLQLGDGIDLKDRIPESKMFEITDDLIDMGVKAVTFSGGGEPLLYRPLPDVIERLAAGGIKIGALTNGANLKGRMADAFAAHGTWIRISVDGWDDASYAEARSIAEGHFTKLLENMRAFVRRGSRCVLGVSFIIGHANHAKIRDFCAMMKDIGVNHVKLSGVVVGNDGATNKAYHRNISAVVTEQIRAASDLNDANFSVIDHYHELDELFAKSYTTCPFLQFLTVIGADCAVYTCQDKAYTQAGLLGSIRDRSFKEFWFSEENRQKLYGLDPSVSCQHHCVAHAKNLAITDILALDQDHAVFV